MAATFFERIAGPPRQAEETLHHPRWSPPTADKLLDWLQTRWPKDIVTVRDVCAYGPGSIRDRNTVFDLAQSLVERGWLIPVKGWRLDMRAWRIVRRPTSAVAGKSVEKTA